VGVYYFTIITAGLFALLAQLSHAASAGSLPTGGYDRATRVFLVLAAFTLIFTAGCRYYVGTDYGAYYKGLTIYGGTFKKDFMALDEPMMPMLADIVGWFTDDGAYLIFLCSLITVGITTYTIFKNADQFLFAMLLYIFIGSWHGSFNGVRQYLAATFVFAGFRYIINKKFFKYALFVFLAFCCHRSAIIMILPFFILRNRITAKNILLLVAGTLFISLNYDAIFSFVGMLKDDEVSQTSAYVTNSVSVMRILVSCAPAIMALIIYARKKPDRYETVYINMLIINAAAMVAASSSTYLARIGIYTGIFIPVALPGLLHLRNKNTEAFLKLLIIGFFAVYWYIDVGDSMRQFYWIWERL
jgi:hypothetical protein